VLTHPIPPPEDEAGEAEYEKDLRSGGYTGQLTVGRDLRALSLPTTG
jgi:hypothetical protein